MILILFHVNYEKKSREISITMTYNIFFNRISESNSVLLCNGIIKYTEIIFVSCRLGLCVSDELWNVKWDGMFPLIQDSFHRSIFSFTESCEAPPVRGSSVFRHKTGTPDWDDLIICSAIIYKSRGNTNYTPRGCLCYRVDIIVNAQTCTELVSNLLYMLSS